MDQNLKAIVEKRIERTVKALQKNGYDAHFVRDKEELLEKIGGYLTAGQTCAAGGSMTLLETGVIDYIKSSGCSYLDQYAPGADAQEVYRQTFSCDVYFMSSNAITEQGELYNVDGNGNRVAALTYGPKKVVIVAGCNKIAKDLDQARLRIRETAAPANNIRLTRPNPCTKTGRCMDCGLDTNICVTEVVTRTQKANHRVTVLLLPECYGY